MNKQKLLETGLFIENNYFDNYVKLIEANSDTKRQTFKTQKHHIIPTTAYDILQWDGKDNDDNLVNLLYKDHILAHYYLALCSKDIAFRHKMICAINFILGKAVQVKLDVEALKKFTLDLDKYQQLYEESRAYAASLLKGTTHDTSEETKAKISLANKGRVYINKNGIVKSINTEDAELYIKQGWIYGNPNCTKRDLHKGDTIVNKEGIEKYIAKDELEKYIAEGWIKGRSESHKKASQKGTQAYYDKLTVEEKHAKCATRLGTHYIMSEEQKQKISQSNIGKKLTAEQKQKNSINKSGTIWMTDGVKDIMIKPKLEPVYKEKGFIRGRTKNRRDKGE